MAIGTTIYSTATLLGVLRDEQQMQPPSNYWLSNFFNSQINFTDEYVDFSKITDRRVLAPLVIPTAQGVPMYAQAERLQRVRPAYLKPKDAVSASRVIQKTVGMGELNTSTEMSPQARYNAIVADIMRTHRRGIERMWEFMACRAIVDASITLEAENYPRTVVDFERDAGHNVTLTAGNRWGDAGVSILESIETIRRTVRRARFGGPLSRITVGYEVWDVMRQDPEIRELLKTDYRPSQQGGLNLNLGVLEGLEVEYVGRLSGTLDVYVYSDYYEMPDGTVVDFIDPRDVILTGGSIQGVRCYGAIQDVEAQFAALEMFPKMWPNKDPSATYIMTQSAPLMVPVNPNNSYKLRPIA